MPEKDTNGWTAVSSAGPTPETLSRRARPPNAPCSLRHATMRCARAGPTRGNRVISLTSALSRSMYSPGISGRASWAARRAVSCSAPGRVSVVDWSRTSPGGAPGEGDRMYRIPAPARARIARRSAALFSSIYVRRASFVVRGCSGWVLEKSPQHLHRPTKQAFQPFAGWMRQILELVGNTNQTFGFCGGAESYSEMPAAQGSSSERVPLHDVCLNRQRGAPQLIKDRAGFSLVRLIARSICQAGCFVGNLPGIERSITVHA